MADYVKKIIPYQFNETDAIEAWLEELAEEGLVLERDGFLGLVFKHSEPTRLRFRVDITRSANLEKNKKRREQLDKKGWQYAGSPGGKVTIYKNEDLGQRELPENPEGDAKKGELNWFVRLVILVLCVCAIALIEFIFAPTGDSPTLYWLTEGFYDLIRDLFAIIYLIFIFGLVQYAIHRVYKSKADNSFYQRRYHTKRRARRRSWVKFACMCLGLLIFITPFFGAAHDRCEFTLLENYQKVLPIPQLSEINEEEGTKLEAACLSENKIVQTQASNEVVDKSYPLLPHQIWLYQAGPEVRREGKITQLLNYYAAYNELLTEGLAERLFQDFMSEYFYESLPSSNGLQACYYHAENDDDWPRQALLLRYETKVLKVKYRGDRDLSQCVNLFAHYLRPTTITNINSR